MEPGRRREAEVDARVHVGVERVAGERVPELVVHRRMRPLLEQFLERHLIPENAIARFEAAIASAFRLRNSVR